VKKKASTIYEFLVFHLRNFSFFARKRAEKREGRLRVLVSRLVFVRDICLCSMRACAQRVAKKKAPKICPGHKKNRRK
jgi:hypothetical protein